MDDTKDFTAPANEKCIKIEGRVLVELLSYGLVMVEGVMQPNAKAARLAIMAALPTVFPERKRKAKQAGPKVVKAK